MGDEPQSMNLNATAASLLGFLHGGDYSGYELVGVAEVVIGDFWTLTRSQVYRELAGLADRGLIEAGEAGPRARRRYRVTPAGRAAFRHWVTQPPGREQIRYPLLLTIAFGAFVGRDQLLAFAADHRRLHAERLAVYADLQHSGGGEDPYARATLAFGVHYERAVLAWMDELPTLLAEAPAGGSPPRDR